MVSNIGETKFGAMCLNGHQSGVTQKFAMLTPLFSSFSAISPPVPLFPHTYRPPFPISPATPLLRPCQQISDLIGPLITVHGPPEGHFGLTLQCGGQAWFVYWGRYHLIPVPLLVFLRCGLPTQWQGSRGLSLGTPDQPHGNVGVMNVTHCS